MAALTVEDVMVEFGAVRALNGVSFELEEGEFAGLIGPNGAGKTTLIDAVTGFVPCSGRVLANGHDLSAQPPHQRVRHGVARTFQSMELFQDLTVRQNLLVAAENRGAAAGTDAAPSSLAERVSFALEVMRLGSVADRPPGSLSLGTQKLIAVARALASGARVLLLDEPAAGLSPEEGEALRDRLERVRAGGVTILLIDHDMDLVLTACSRVIVLSFGKILTVGTPSQIRSNPQVRSAYLGEDETAAA